MRNEKDAADFEKLELQLHACRHEISELSKTKPNDPLNKFKLTLINQIITKMNSMLGDKQVFDDFTIFDSDVLPSNSDVVFVLAQYTDAAHTYREQNTQRDGQDYCWKLKSKQIFITASPQSRKYRE
jgi:hypothetical protein